MAYDKQQVAEKLRYWQRFMQNFHLPTWEELPDLELYMDQVVSLVVRYVNLQPHSAPKDSILTASAVNNYVRLKLIPPPVKKRYSRVHLAHLIVICCLKGSMSLSSIQQMFPIALSEEEAQRGAQPGGQPGPHHRRGKHAVQAGHRQSPGSSNAAGEGDGTLLLTPQLIRRNPSPSHKKLREDCRCNLHANFLGRHLYGACHTY